MTKKFRGFRAERILGELTYHLRIESDVTIVVGPNGTGKSTFLNLFYLFLTRQWTRLREFNFSTLTLELEDREISISKTNLLTADPSNLKISPTIKNYLNRLAEANLTDRFLTPGALSSRFANQVADTLSISRSDVSTIRSYLMHRSRDLFEISFFETEKQLAELNLEKVLFLPTYRRIEKDLKSIFPDIEERFRTRLSENQISTRQGQGFAEIVSFGMEDIARMIGDFTAKLNSIAKNKSNSAAQEYIRDMVRGQIRDYSIGPIRDVDPDVITQFVNRLDNQLLSLEDKNLLRRDIDALRKKRVGKPSRDMQYLGFFVEKMLNVYLELQHEEAPLIQFTEIVQKYFSNKHIRYDNYNFVITDLDGNEIKIDDLSSGEKQIISVFAYLLLTGENSYFVFIDEPELSLSVPWQKTFLPDIIDTAKCEYLFAVTHSPFVFDNDLRSSIIDVRKLRSKLG